MHAFAVSIVMKKEKFRETKSTQIVSLIAAWWSSFRVTLAAIYWSAAVWLERNFAFLSAVSANCFVCFFLIHLLLSSYGFECKEFSCTLPIYLRTRFKLIHF